MLLIISALDDVKMAELAAVAKSVGLDLLVANVLMAMGMSMVSPTLISIPLKIFLFVALSGWSRLMHGLILSYG